MHAELLTDQIYVFLHSVKMKIQRGTRSMIIMRKKKKKERKVNLLKQLRGVWRSNKIILNRSKEVGREHSVVE